MEKLQNETPCEKRRFSKRSAGITLTNALIRQNAGDKDRHEQRIYQCKNCGYWHLSHYEEWEDRHAQN